MRAGASQSPAALVVLKRGAFADAEALKTWCLDNGPKYAHPGFVQIINEKDLPLNVERRRQDRSHARKDPTRRFLVRHQGG